MPIQPNIETSGQPTSTMLRATKKLDTDFRICLYHGGPVAVSRLRKLLTDIDGRKGKPSFLAMYRRFCQIVRHAGDERIARMQEAVSAALTANAEDETASVACVHEIAHVAIPHYYRFGVHSYPVRYSKDGSGVFEYRDPAWNNKLVIAEYQRIKALLPVGCIDHREALVLCDLAGEVAEAILHSEEPPQFVLPAQNDPASDLFKVKIMVREIRGFDDEGYQSEMQSRCADILMDPRMWEAIIVAASFLYERMEMDGGEIQEIFWALSAPQLDFSSLAR
jgi:hypothetical protein